jgi:capsular exopolysaccharide synthesis family protein
MLSSDNRMIAASSPSTNIDRPLHDLMHGSSAAVMTPTAVLTANTASPDQTHLREYLSVVLKRKWLILSVMIVVTSLVAVYMYRQPDIFKAQATILIERKQKSFLKTAEFNINQGYDNNFRNTQLKLLESPLLMRQVVQTLDLQNNPAFFGGQSRGLLASVRGIFKSKEDKAAAAAQGGLAVADDAQGTPSGEVTQLADARSQNLTPEQLLRLEAYENALRAGLKIEQVEKTDLVEISFTHQSPLLARDVANTVAEVFRANDARRENEGSQNQASLLARQITDLQLKIRNLESQRINYMQSNDIPLSEMKGQNVTAVRLETYSAQALEAEKQRKDLQASYEAAQRSRDIMSIPEVQRNDTIMKMRDRISIVEEQRAALLVNYTEENPRVIEKDEQIAQLRRDIDRSARQTVAALKAQYEGAIAKENQLRATYSKERGVAGTQSRAEILLSSLNQELETNKQLFNTALQRARELEITSGDRVANIAIATEAREPRAPVGPPRERNILIALLLSLGAGIGLAILLDHLDDSLKSVEDVDRYIHLPTLALIPAPRAERGRLRGIGRTSTELQTTNAASQTALSLIEDARSPIAEAYRHLRTSLLLSSAGQPPKSVLVTSSQPSEGKTTTAVNTAVMLAQTGVEVLLLDCDLRRPRLHAHFGMVNNRGLTNYLAGEVELDEVIQPFDKLPNLKVMASGPVPPNPAELLGSEEMRKLLRELSGRFTHIIIDSPPSISFTDAAILSTLVDGVMLVVHGGRSSRASRAPRTPADARRRRAHLRHRLKQRQVGIQRLQLLRGLLRQLL